MGVISAIMPAGWLQNYIYSIQTPSTFENQKMSHALISENTHENNFSAKSTGKLQYSTAAEKINIILIRERRCISAAIATEKSECSLARLPFLCSLYNRYLKSSFRTIATMAELSLQRL